MAKVLAHDQERPSASPMATSCFARATRYPPRRSGTRHHPAGQTCWASDDRTRVPLNGNLSAPSAKVAPANSVAPPKVAPSNEVLSVKVTPPNWARLAKVAPLNQAQPPKVVPENMTSSAKVAGWNSAVP